MSVPISESTASTPKASNTTFPPQQQFAYIVVKNDNTKEVGLVDFFGNLIGKGNDEGVLRKATDLARQKGPLLIMPGTYKFPDVDFKYLSVTGSGETFLDGQVDAGFCTISHLKFGRQNWKDKQKIEINHCSFDSLDIEAVEGKMIFSTVGKLNMRNSKFSVLFSEITDLDADGSDFIITCNRIRRAKMNVEKSIFASNQVKEVEGLREYHEFLNLCEDTHRIKVGHVPISAASGGTQFPAIKDINDVKLHISHITFQDQRGEPTFFIGGAENPPYFEPSIYPQSLGYPLKGIGDGLKLPMITNLSQIRAVSTVSGAYLSYFGVT